MGAATPTGTQGEGALKCVVVGSVPHKLLQVAETPVVVVSG